MFMGLLCVFGGVTGAVTSVTSRLSWNEFKKTREPRAVRPEVDRKSTRLNSSHSQISYAVFCLKKKKIKYYYIVTHMDSCNCFTPALNSRSNFSASHRQSRCLTTTDNG